LDIFQLAPRLPDVILDLRSGPASHIPLVSWGQLTHLSLDHDSPQVCLDILVPCTNLVSAHFGTNQGRKEDPPIVEKCVLKHMGIACLHGHMRRGRAFGPFPPPAVPRAKIPISYPRSPRVDPVWFISRPTPTLIQLLTQSPHLEYLMLNDSVFAEDLLDILQHTPNRTPARCRLHGRQRNRRRVH
jgi:hypothetical protein